MLYIVCKQGDEILCGEPNSLKGAFDNSPHVLEGEMKTGAQEHFYMETHATLAVPHEDGEMELFGKLLVVSPVAKYKNGKVRFHYCNF